MICHMALQVLGFSALLARSPVNEIKMHCGYIGIVPHMLCVRVILGSRQSCLGFDTTVRTN